MLKYLEYTPISYMYAGYRTCRELKMDLIMYAQTMSVGAQAALVLSIVVSIVNAINGFTRK